MGTSAKYTCADGVTAWKYCSRKLSVLCRGDIGRRETSTRRKMVENVKIKLVSEGRSIGGRSAVLGGGQYVPQRKGDFHFRSLLTVTRQMLLSVHRFRLHQPTREPFVKLRCIVIE